MIVRRGRGALYLITQPDHAALAARIMRLWQPLFDAERRASILHAIEQHDNGWREADDAPTVDTDNGRVHDFVTAPAAVRQGVWPRGIARLAGDPWAAALVAQHALTVYDRYTSDPEWLDFFRNIALMRDQLIAMTPSTLADLESDYHFVRIGDLISLIFCNQWDDERYGSWTFRRDNDRVVVTPYAFQRPEIFISVAARELPDRSFAFDEELQRTMKAAPAVTLTGTIVSG
jgi:hypothetical protein